MFGLKFKEDYVSFRKTLCLFLDIEDAINLSHTCSELRSVVMCATKDVQWLSVALNQKQDRNGYNFCLTYGDGFLHKIASNLSEYKFPLVQLNICRVARLFFRSKKQKLILYSERDELYSDSESVDSVDDYYGLNSHVSKVTLDDVIKHMLISVPQTWNQDDMLLMGYCPVRKKKMRVICSVPIYRKVIVNQPGITKNLINLFNTLAIENFCLRILHRKLGF